MNSQRDEDEVELPRIKENTLWCTMRQEGFTNATPGHIESNHGEDSYES